MLAVLMAGPAAAAEPALEILVAESSATTRLEDGVVTGYWVDLIGLAAARAEVAVQFRLLPYARALREVSEGTHACNPIVARTRARESVYSWVAQTRRLLIGAFVLRGAVDPPRTLAQLKRSQIAVMRGTLGDLTLSELGIEAQRVTDTRRMTLMLARGRVAVVVSDLQVAMAEAADAAIEIDEAMRLSETPGYLACSPGLDPAVAGRLGAAIDDIFRAGEDRAIAAANALDPSYEVVRPQPR